MSLLSSDGLGRTGTFIAIWSLIEQMKAEGQIDVVGTIKSIRTQRPGAMPHMVRGMLQVEHVMCMRNRVKVKCKLSTPNISA